MSKLKALHKKFKGKNDYNKSLAKFAEALIATLIGLGAATWGNSAYWLALTPLLLSLKNFVKHR